MDLSANLGFVNGFKIIQRRQVVIAKKYRWPNRVVPYIMSANIDEGVKNLVLSGINEFNTKTCVKWVPRGPQDHNYVDVFYDPGYPGCTCEVGGLHGAKILRMSKNCGGDRGLVMHEMMHCIGFLHEHARDDRDEYIKINYENMQPGLQSEFAKASQIYPNLHPFMLGLPYDYNSLMHYKPTTYSAKRQTVNAFIIVLSIPLPVIESKKPGVTVGAGDTFTDLDIKKISLYYECDGSAPSGGPPPVAKAAAASAPNPAPPAPTPPPTSAPKMAPSDTLNKNPFFSDIESEASSNDEATEVTGEGDADSGSDGEQNSGGDAISDGPSPPESESPPEFAVHPPSAVPQGSGESPNDSSGTSRDDQSSDTDPATGSDTEEIDKQNGNRK